MGGAPWTLGLGSGHGPGPCLPGSPDPRAWGQDPPPAVWNSSRLRQGVRSRGVQLRRAWRSWGKWADTRVGPGWRAWEPCRLRATTRGQAGGLSPCGARRCQAPGAEPRVLGRHPHARGCPSLPGACTSAVGHGRGQWPASPRQHRPGTQLSQEDTPPRRSLTTGHSHDPPRAARPPGTPPVTLTFSPPAPAGG